MYSCFLAFISKSDKSLWSSTFMHMENVFILGTYEIPDLHLCMCNVYVNMSFETLLEDWTTICFPPIQTPHFYYVPHSLTTLHPVNMYDSLPSNGQLVLPKEALATPHRMRALFDYNPQELSPNPDLDVELSFRQGDNLMVYGEMDDDGFFVVSDMKGSVLHLQIGNSVLIELP